MARNAIRHGLLSSRETLLPGEDETLFESLRDRLFEHLAPLGPLEELLVDRVVGLAWRLRRLNRVEAGVYAALVPSAKRANFDPLEAYKRHLDPAICNDAPIAEANKEGQAARRATLEAFGHAFIADATGPDAFAKLARYDTALGNQLMKSLHELERLQARRAGGNVPAPVAVDVSVSSECR